MPDRPQEQVEIRKYPNRRYYDATQSRHVTLEDIRDLIRDGREVRVVDSRSGEDITGKTLTQIILELETPKLEVFPNALLHRLIRANEQLIQDFVQKYFNQALTSFLDSQKRFESWFRQAMALHGARDPAAAWADLFNPLAPFGSQPAGKASTGPAEAGENLAAVVAELRAEVEALKKARGGRRKARPSRRRG